MTGVGWEGMWGGMGGGEKVETWIGNFVYLINKKA